MAKQWFLTYGSMRTKILCGNLGPRAYIYIHTSVCMYVFIYLFVYLYMCWFIYLFIFKFILFILFIYLYIYIYISLYICILNMHISVYYFLYLSRAFLAHVLRPNSCHCCSNFTSHCRSVTSLPQKKAPETCACFPLPCMCPSSAHLFPHSCDFLLSFTRPGPQVLRLRGKASRTKKFWFGQSHAEKDGVYHRGRSWTLQH